MPIVGHGSATDQLNILLRLETLPQPVYLTGSRFFGTERKDSDWDFFTLDTDNIRDHLVELGFRLESHSPYRQDLFTVAVYHHPADIHVQLVPNVAEKSAAQEVLHKLDLGLAMQDKDMRRRLWRVALAAIRKGFEMGTHIGHIGMGMGMGADPIFNEDSW